MVGWFQELLARWQAVSEIDALSERDLDELGLSRSQARALARTPPTVTDRVARMTSVYGLTAGDMQRDVPGYRDLVAACATCGCAATCRDMLQEAARLSPDDVAFCPNAAVYSQKAGHQTDPLSRFMRLA